jgi:hypothetical protein
MPKHNKQHDARAASFIRMARKHRARGNSWRKIAHNSRSSEGDRVAAAGLASVHFDTADIFENEARTLRAMR